MYKVCNHKLQVISECDELALAKAEANTQANEHPEHVFFVCGSNGMVMAGFFTCKRGKGG